MIGRMLSLMRPGNLAVDFPPLKSEQVNLIFSEENLQDEVVLMHGYKAASCWRNGQMQTQGTAPRMG